MNFRAVGNWTRIQCAGIPSPSDCYSFVILSPARSSAAGSHYAKDLCSWAAPLRWTEGIAVLPKIDITLSSVQRAAALVGGMPGGFLGPHWQLLHSGRPRLFCMATDVSEPRHRPPAQPLSVT